MNMHPRSGPISRRAMLTTVLAGTAGALLTACGSPAPATGPAAAASSASAAAKPATAPVISGNYEVTFLTTQTSPADVKIYEQLASRFHELNSNLTVKITAESGTNIDQKLLTYLTAGTLPDIVHTSDNFAKPYKDNK